MKAVVPPDGRRLAQNGKTGIALLAPSFVTIVCWAAISLGAAGIVGQLLSLAISASVFPAFLILAPGDALGLLLTGLSLQMAHSPLAQAAGAQPQRRSIPGLVFAVAVVAISVATLSKHIDIPAIRMAPTSALSLLLMSAALCLVHMEWGTAVFQSLGLTAAFLGTLALTGHILFASTLYAAGSATPMSVLMAIACGALGLAIAFVRPDRGLMTVLASSNAGGTAARRLLPLAMSLPFLLLAVVRWIQYRRPGQLRINLSRGLGTIFFILAVELFIAAPVVWVVALFDRIEKRRRSVEARISMLAHSVRSVSECICITDMQDRVLFVNDAFLRTYGFDEKELLGNSIEVVRSANNPESIAMEILPATLRGGWKGEVLNRRRDGMDFPISLSTSVVRDDTGEPFALAGVAVDITERKRAERELVEAREAAEAAARAKSQFLASMSHEIRTPMNGVIGMTELLLNTPLTAEQLEYVQTIHVSGENLLTIINDILDFSKIESENVELENRPFEIRDAIEDVLDLLAPRAIEKGLDLVYLVEQQVPAFIMGDVTRFKQVLINLVGNGVKFTPSGEVYVHAAFKSLESGGFELTCSVKDTGVGISTAKQDRLFKAFSQVDASTSRRFGGTGLGLAISKRLVELMGGRLWVESQPDRGSTFSFTLITTPVEFVAASAKIYVQGNSTDLEGKRVLVVDDNETNLRVLSALLLQWKLTVRATSSPAEALEWIRGEEAFDIAILDMHMPIMNGSQLGVEIRKLRSAEVLPLILLHSSAQSTLDLSAGTNVFAAIAPKPLRRTQLLDLILNSLSDGKVIVRERHPIHRLDSTVANRLPLKILVAEDNPVNQKLLLRILAQMGYTPDHADNGKLALDAILRSHYDVVFMDVHMPEMDGLEVTRRVCAALDVSERPRIIAMTAAAMVEDRDKCLDAGMDDYVRKPVRLQDIQMAVERCGTRKNPVLGEFDRMSGAEANSENAIRSRIDEIRGIGSEGFLSDLLIAYIKDAAQHCSKIQALFEESNFEGLAFTAHALKGSSQNIGAERLAEICLGLQQAAQSPTKEGIGHLLTYLHQEHRHVSRILQSIGREIGSDRAARKIPS